MQDIQSQQTLPTNEESNVRMTHIMYALQAFGYGLSIFFGITYFLSIISVIIAYVKYPDVKGTWLESHFKWQIRTFWWGFLWFIIGLILLLIFGLGSILSSYFAEGIDIASLFNHGLGNSTSIIASIFSFLFSLIAFALLVINFIWIAYRIIRGWLALNEKKALNV